MRPYTRDVLLWLAGLGGAAMLLRTTLDFLEWASRWVPATLLGALLTVAVAGTAALVAVRGRLRDDAPVAFRENRP